MKITLNQEGRVRYVQRPKPFLFKVQDASTKLYWFTFFAKRWLKRKVEFILRTLIQRFGLAMTDAYTAIMQLAQGK